MFSVLSLFIFFPRDYLQIFTTEVLNSDLQAPGVAASDAKGRSLCYITKEY